MKPGRNWFQRLLSPDRRSAERHISPQLVAYYWNGATPVAHGIRDISSTGLYLLTEERWYPGTLVMMTLQRSDHGAYTRTYTRNDRFIAVWAKAVRSGADGVGFQFVFPESGDYGKAGLMDGADRKTFADFVWRYREDGCVEAEGFPRWKPPHLCGGRSALALREELNFQSCALAPASRIPGLKPIQH